MRYNQIRECDIANGYGIGTALFVQGCHFHCKNCFNSETWDFNGGKEWDDEIKNKFLNISDKSYITRISILGGEPLAEENIDCVEELIKTIRDRFGDTKKIWLYTGYVIEGMDKHQKNVISMCDIVVDGLFIDELKDYSLQFKGSKNQRIIDVRCLYDK